MQIHVVLMIMTGLLTTGTVAVPPSYILARLAEDFQVTTMEKSVNEPLTEPHIVSSRRCCKLGERVGYRQLPCSLDLHITSRTDNIVFKQKYKPINANSQEHFSSDFKTLKWYQSGILANEIMQCHKYKKVFEKCCSIRNMDPKYNDSEYDFNR